MNTCMPSGKRVIVSAFGATRGDALDAHVSLESMEAPDSATLLADEIVITIKSAAVAWVDLPMTGGQYRHMPAPLYCSGMQYSGVIAWAGAVHSGRIRLRRGLQPARPLRNRLTRCRLCRRRFLSVRRQSERG